MMDWKAERELLSRWQGEYDHALRTTKKERAALEAAEEAISNTEEAQRITQEAAEKVQSEVHARIASVVSRCLSAVFAEPYEFRIVFEQKRGRTEARLVFLRDGQEADPMNSCGGGVIDVASFALRLACLMLHRPRLRKVLIADEPFKMLSKEYRENVNELLRGLAKDLGMQFIIVTHSEELVIGREVRLE